jgi:hypothetical protein
MVKTLKILNLPSAVFTALMIFPKIANNSNVWRKRMKILPYCKDDFNKQYFWKPLHPTV